MESVKVNYYPENRHGDRNPKSGAGEDPSMLGRLSLPILRFGKIRASAGESTRPRRSIWLTR